jgi:putative ABC transport system permease protein
MSTISLLAWKMLLHNCPRLFFSLLGVSTAFFLAAAQFGLLIGWISATTALINHAVVDLWVMAKNTRAYDYAPPIPRQYLYRVRSVSSVDWAQAQVVVWNIWVRPNGSTASIQLIGLDQDGVGGPWQMASGTLQSIHKPETVIVDELYRNLLQVHALSDTAQMNNMTAKIGGFSQGVRSFSGTPHVFSSLKQALIYDLRYQDDEITYVLVRCRKSVDSKIVQNELREKFQEAEILTSDEFAERTARYWMLGTGAGIGVVLTAILGLLVGAIIASQTLFATTQENICNYMTLLAIGFDRRILVRVLLLQSLIVGVTGIIIGSLEFMPLYYLTELSPLSIAFNPYLYIGLISLFLLICVLSSSLSIRCIFKLDPVEIFSQR